MYRNYKIVPFIPAGRKKTMMILFNYFEKFADIIDEVQIWQNTKNAEDLAWFKQVADNNPKYKIYKVPEAYRFIDNPVQYNTGRFYEYTTDPDTIYVRFDDDIVYIDDDYFKNILDFRIDNPEYFLVFGNIWNNAITSYIQQKQGKLHDEICTVERPYCMDMCGWGNPKFAEYIHNVLLGKIEEGKVSDLYFNNDKLTPEGVYLLDAYRFSISNFAYFGKDFQDFPKGPGKLDFNTKYHGINAGIPVAGFATDPADDAYPDEEIWLTEIHPLRTGRKNVILGNAIVSHFTFSPYQKKHIVENTDIYDRYQMLSEKKLSEEYYKKLQPHV